MGKTVYFRQTKLTQLQGTGTLEHVAWIPEEFARIGAPLEIDGMEGQWTVVEVWGRRPKDWVIGRERDYKKQRGVSDV